MPSNLLNDYFPTMRRVRQITSAHCGPAVLKMLLSFQGIKVYQREIVQAAGVGHKLATHGMTVDEMGRAIDELGLPVDFWYKDHATIEELNHIIHSHHHPVGVEWQGKFEEFSDGDDGHYAVATHIDIAQNQIFLSDPFGRFALNDREFSLGEFRQRWWEVNEIIDPDTHQRQNLRDDQMMFVITKRGEHFPEDFNMVLG